MSTSNKPVIIRVEHNADAKAIIAVVNAMGFAVTREPMADASNHVEWLVDDFAARCKLTVREIEIVKLIVIEGVLENIAIGKRLAVSPMTVKWYLHNVFTKTGTNGREQLLRRALGLSIV